MKEVSEEWGFDLSEWGISEAEKKATEMLSELKFSDVYYTPEEKPKLNLEDCIDADLYKKKCEYVDTLDLTDEQKRVLKMLAYRIEGGRDNIAWDTYEEDWPFTNEPKRRVENGK